VKHDVAVVSDPGPGAADAAGERYRVYVLRLWCNREQPRRRWRCSLEDPATGQRRGFASPEGLAGYLVGIFGEADSNDTTRGRRVEEESHGTGEDADRLRTDS
jgi:hypothetical protein